MGRFEDEKMRIPLSRNAGLQKTQDEGVKQFRILAQIKFNGGF
jgi:hypothetical protein